MSTMKDVEKAVRIFRKNKCKFILMHCVSNYPTKEENLNLRMINTLKKQFFSLSREKEINDYLSPGGY